MSARYAAKYEATPYKVDADSSRITSELLDRFIARHKGKRWCGPFKVSDPIWSVGFEDEDDAKLFQTMFGPKGD